MHILRFACVLVCRRENVGDCIRATSNIKFLVKLGKSGNEIREMLVQVYGDNAMKKTAVYKWVKRFSEGRESVTDEEDGQQQAELKKKNIAKVRQTVRENRWLTVRSIAE